MREREVQAGPTTAAFVIMTVMMFAVAVYGPLFVAFPWMWSGGELPPLVSVVFVTITPGVWLGWHRLLVTGALSRARWHTVWLSAALTVAYGAGLAADFAAGALELWRPSLLVAALGYLAVSLVAGRTCRTHDPTSR